MKDMAARGKEDAGKNGKNEGRRVCTWIYVQTRLPSVMPSWYSPSLPLGVISFVVDLHVNSRANSSSFILAFFSSRNARMGAASSHVNSRANTRWRKWQQEERGTQKRTTRMKDDEFAREFTCKLVVLLSCRLDIRAPFVLVSFLRRRSAREFTCKLVVLHSCGFSIKKRKWGRRVRT